MWRGGARFFILWREQQDVRTILFTFALHLRRQTPSYIPILFFSPPRSPPVFTYSSHDAADVPLPESDASGDDSACSTDLDTTHCMGTSSDSAEGPSECLIVPERVSNVPVLATSSRSKLKRKRERKQVTQACLGCRQSHHSMYHPSLFPFCTLFPFTLPSFSPLHNHLKPKELSTNNTSVLCCFFFSHSAPFPLPSKSAPT